MRETILTYFGGEKHGAMLLVAGGAVALTAAVALFPARWGVRSLAITTGVFALIYLALGIGLYLRTDPQVERLLAQLASAPSAFTSGELARMARVQRSFVLIEAVELVFIVGGALAAVAMKNRPTLCGVAVALALNAAFLMAFDLSAERRGAAYLAALQGSTPE